MLYIPQKGIKDKTENTIMLLLYNDVKAFSNTLNVACCSGALTLKKRTEALRVSQKSNEDNKSYKTASSQLLEFWGDDSWGVWQQSFFESWGSWSIQTVLSFTNLSVKDIGVWGKNSKRQFENKWRVTFSQMRCSLVVGRDHMEYRWDQASSWNKNPLSTN